MGVVITNMPASETDFSPSAARLVDSLRDTGYSTEAAFADIIDNSIAAGATKIRIELLYLLGEVRVIFTDNGHGMTEQELVAGMRYGSPKRANPKSLGKFGMGLKTASTAFCERLVVISTRDGSIHSRAWDLGTIRDTDQWQLETPEKDDYLDDHEELEAFCSDSGSGSMIIWEKIDRLIHPGDEKRTIKQLEDLGQDLDAELSAVFARFLDHSEDSCPNVSISLSIGNGNETALHGWDPLCLKLNVNSEGIRVQRLKEKKITVQSGNGEDKYFTLSGSILPNKNDLTSQEEKDVRYTLDNQGLYIYREGRLIWHDGWPQRMYKKESKITRLRVVLNFDHELDDLFSIDFRKSRIIIPKSIRDELKTIIAPWRNHTLRSPAPQASGEQENRSSQRHRPADNAIIKQQGNTKNSEITIEGNKVLIRNKHNPTRTEVDGVHVYANSDVKVIEEDSLPGNVLWDAALDHEGNTCLQLGRSHPFFTRLYATCKDTPDAILALDMILWSLANAEFGTWSEKNKLVMKEFRQHVSDSLNYLSHELPDAEEH
ncbi:ATP-binding protein [Neptunomonas sp.]|uniref:ATP-binding protein n=1 Tax=Neptunomonas sp. TaxID=1971898 RepID=UPI0035680E59